MTSAYVLIVQIALTNQFMPLGQPSQEACLADLARIHAGVYTSITLDSGVIVPLARGIECVSAVEFEARKGGGV